MTATPDRASLQDLERCLEIERAASPAPWSRAAMEQELQRSGALPLVIRDQETGQVLAFLCYQQLPDQLEVLNLATHPDHRRQGLARQLMQSLINEAQQTGCHQLLLELRTTNKPAMKLYQSLGFNQVGLRKNYYPQGEHAALMQRDLK